MRLLSLLALALITTSCDQAPVACTLIGCDDSLALTVTGPDGALAPGRYAVSVGALDGDRAVADCAFTVGAGGELSDEAARCAVIAREGEDGGATLFLAPLTGRLQIDVTRDDALVFRQILQPAYQDVYPNGIDCGAVCQTAQLLVTVG